MNKNIFSTLLLLLVSQIIFSMEARSADDPLKKIKYIDSYEACKSIPTINESEYNSNKAYWDQVESQCHVQIQKLPGTGLFGFMSVMVGYLQKPKESDDFLRKVGAQALADVQLNIKFDEVLARCERKDKNWFDGKLKAATSADDKKLYTFSSCGKVVDAMLAKVNEQRPIMRHELALAAYRPGAVNKINAQNSINWKLHLPSGLPGPLQPEALTPAEQQAAAREYNQETQAFTKDYLKAKSQEGRAVYANQRDYNLVHPLADPNTKVLDKCDVNKQVNDNLCMGYESSLSSYRGSKLQPAHLEKYMNALSQAPILAYLNQTNPTPEQIAAAADIVLKNGQEEAANIQGALAADARGTRTVCDKVDCHEVQISDEEKAHSLLTLMKYRPVVDQVLKQNPALCATAAKTINFISGTDLRNNGAFMVGMLGASAALAWLGPEALLGTALEGVSGGVLASAAAVPVSLGMYAHTYSEVHAAEARANTGVVQDGTFGAPIGKEKEWADAKEAWQTSLMLAATGVDFWGLPVVKTAGLVGSAVMMGKLFEKQGAELALKSLLQEKGLAAGEIKTVIASLKSGNDATVSKAAAVLVDRLKLSTSETKLVRTMGQKGLLGVNGNATRYMDDLMKALPKSPAEHERVIGLVMKELESLNPAILNNQNRELITKAITASANFGVTNPKQIALNLSQWDHDSIQGLTKVYEAANKKLFEPKYLAIKDLNARQERAFNDSLEDIMKGKPEFKNMSAVERRAMEKQMCSCAACKI